MFIAVSRKVESDEKEELYIVPETALEEKFVVWFAFQRGIRKKTIRKKDSLQFPSYNDPKAVLEVVNQAFLDFKKRFKYVEVPDVVGLTMETAAKRLQDEGIHWAVEREKLSHKYPRGVVSFQRPSSGVVSTPESVVYLTVSKGRA